MAQARFNRIVSAIPPQVPFVAPEAIERRLGRAFRLRMGANESPFGPSPRAVEAMATAAATSNHYNDPDAYELRCLIAPTHGGLPTNVVVGAGIDDLLMLLCRAFLDPGDAAVSSLGGYPTFAYAVRSVGASLLTAPYRNDRNDLDALLDLARGPTAKILYLADPDNPSGTRLPPSDIESLRAGMPGGKVLLLDQAYADFIRDPPKFEPEDAGVIRLRTFSKAHGMAGLRVGYALASSEIARGLEKIRLHFSVNRVAQAGAIASLGDSGFLAEVVRRTAEARTELAGIGERAGLRPIPSWTNFVTLDTGGRERAEVILSALQEKGVFIRKPGRPPLDSCIRVTVGLPQEQALFAEILAGCVDGLPG